MTEDEIFSNDLPHSRALLEHDLNTMFNAIAERPDLPRLINRPEDLAKKVYNIIVNGKAPGNTFPFVANGAYKECYKLNKNYVVKFISDDNHTDWERGLLNAAITAGLGSVFLPTYFIDFYGFNTPLPYISDCDCDRESCFHLNTNETSMVPYDDYVPPIATNLAVQPRIAYTVADDPLDINWDFEAAYKNGEPLIVDRQTIPYEIVATLRIASQKWLKFFVQSYSYSALERLAAFVKKYNISDLHNHNIGYLDSGADRVRPVIIDWLSNEVSTS